MNRKFAYYMSLIVKTFKSIIAFLFILILLIVTLSSALYIISKMEMEMDFDELTVSNERRDMPGVLTEHIKDQNVLNVLIYVYLLALGEFDFEDFSNREGPT